jgi:phosphopantothenoylcysteine decarboxylase/phosphopantothenate--cysteine ligase
VARGGEKLRRKGADLIVANDISRDGAGFESDLNEATILSADGAERFPLGPKTALAVAILDRVESRLERTRSSA